MRLQGTKVKASVEGLKARIQKVMDEQTAKYEKDLAAYEKKLDKWAIETQKALAALTLDEIKEERGDRYSTFYPISSAVSARPQRPDPVERNHQRLLNMLELTSEETLTLSLDSEFHRYL